MFLYEPGGLLPEGWRATLYGRPVTCKDLFFIELMRGPGTTVRCDVMEQRLEAIQRFGEFRIVALRRFELGPKIAKLGGLRIRQQRKNPLRRQMFPFRLTGMHRRIMERRIAGIDLYDIVEEEHLHDADHVDRRCCML